MDGVNNLIIQNKIKTQISKKQCEELFNATVKEDLRNIQTFDLNTYKPVPVIYLIDPKSTKATFCTDAHVNKSSILLSSIGTKYFQDLFIFLMKRKLKEPKLTLEELLNIFTSHVMDKVSNLKHSGVYRKKISYKIPERYIIFKGIIDLGVKKPNEVQTQESIREHIQTQFPKGYQYLIQKFETEEYTNRSIGFLIVDTLRYGMCGISLLGVGEYLLNFQEMTFEFDNKKQTVLMTSPTDFVETTGSVWSKDYKRRGARKMSTQVPVSKVEEHPLYPTFSELGLNMKLLPKNKKDTQGILNYVARNVPRNRAKILHDALNEWDGKAS